MTQAIRILDDANAATALRGLLSAQSGGTPADSQGARSSEAAGKTVTTISCKDLSRLDYPVLQAMLRLAPHYHFCDLGHLEHLLERYGVTGLLLRVPDPSQ